MIDFIHAMEIFSKYSDYPSFDYDNIDKQIETDVDNADIDEDSPDGLRLAELGWAIGPASTWVLYL